MLIFDELILQKEIDEALKPIKNEYNIDIDYSYKYNEKAYKIQFKTILGYMKQIAGTCYVILEKNEMIDDDWVRDILVRMADECDDICDELEIEHNMHQLTGPDKEIIKKIDLIIKRLDGD